MRTTPDKKFFHPDDTKDHDVNVIGEWIIIRNIPTLRGTTYEHVIVHRCKNKIANPNKYGVNTKYYDAIAHRFNEPSERNACYYCDKPVPDEIKMIGILLTATP